MKIKNILHAAALRFCLVAIAMSTATMAYAATHQATNPQPSGEIVNNLTAINELSISWNDTFEDTDGNTTDGLTANTYYDTNGISKAWYNLSNRDVKDKDYLDWKSSSTEQAITFKLNSGTYKLTVKYKSGTDDKGIWVYPGTSRPESSETGFYEDGKFDGSKEIPLSGDQCWTIGSTAGTTIRLYSITVEKIETETPTAPNLKAITEPYFWYYNGGGGFSNSSIYGTDGKSLHYRHLPTGNVSASCSTNKTTASVNYVYINGEEIGGDNSNAGGTEQWGSYIFEKGDAIGFKLDPGKDYRIKVYLVDRGSEIDNRVLYKGVNVETATRVDANVYQQTISVMDGATPNETTTRLITYEINKANAGVYWIKNAIDAKLYIGGFEVLPKNYPDFADVFTGENGWYVKDNCCDPITTALSSTQTVDYPVSGNNVVVYGPDMATNFFDLSGRSTVMLNNGSKFGVRLKKGAKLTFTIAGDPGVYAKVTDKDGTQLAANGGGGFADVTYTATADQEVWITGSSEQYVYFSGFEVTQPEPVDPGIEFTAIDKDYVWYPVAHELFGNGKFSDEKHTVYIYEDFSPRNSTSSEIYNNNYIKLEYKLHGQNKTAYRVSCSNNNKVYSVMGFKIASGKKGVINCYFPDNGATGNFVLYQSNDPNNLGTSLSKKDGSMGDNVNFAQYTFDTTEGAKTFWFKANSSAVWFGGFEVLFDDDNETAKSIALNTTYSVTGTETITNALGTDTYSALKSESNAPVAGASMLLCPGIAENAVMVYNRNGVRNAILVKVPTETKYLNVKGYLTNNAHFKVYKGTASDPTSNGVVVDGSNTNVLLTDLGDVTNDAVYWITSDDAAGAYLTSVTPLDGVFSELQLTNTNYIYKVNGVPSSDNGGVQNSGDCNGRIMFVDQNGAAWIDSNSKMNVLGTEVSPVVVENGTDFFAVKVDEGPNNVKTGYVKVYFNGGNAGNHKMEELPLDDPMYSGWNSSYDRDSHVISFDSNGGGRGWWFGNEGAGARDLSAYNKINIQLGKVTGSPNLQVVVQCSNGAFASFPADLVNNRILGDLDVQSNWHDGDNGAKFDITKISQIYIQDNNVDDTNATVKITSARLMNKPVVIATDNDADPANGYTEVFGGKIYNMADGYVYEYPFDLNKVTPPQHIWITGAGAGTLNIAAIEVLYDSNHAKVVDWYVNKDTKMIVGSDDPAFVMKDFDGNDLTYPSGYDEYVTFYMSSGRQANVSFIMPEAVSEVYDWEQASDKDKSYGKHTIELSKPDSKEANYNPKKIAMQSEGITYNRKGANGKTTNGIYETTSIKEDIYKWYAYSYKVPASNKDEVQYTDENFWAATVITATQKKDGSDDIETVDGKLGQWKIYMRFVSYKAPIATRSGNDVTVTAGQDNKYKIYYTLDSSDPENYGILKGEAKDHSSTEEYKTSVGVTGKNCIFKAAQYINTPFAFYEDIAEGKDSPTSNVLKVVSKDLAIDNDIPSVVFVKNTNLTDDELFNKQDGGYMLTIPTGSTLSGVTPHEQAYNANPLMYLTLGGKDHPYLNGNNFDMCGTNWEAGEDSGLKTYLDSYQKKMADADVNNPSWWSTSGTQNKNPYTECNGGPGGADTENGGMFLQPIGGTMLRFEPEYDGVITVWLRQNGCLDNNSQENGKFARRPVYVMDENGRIMRRSTIRPTDEHYMGINGTWAINSSVCEQRSQVEHTWLYEVAKQAFANHPLYANRFGDDFPNRWETLNHDHSGHILYGWWYKGFDLSATRSMITSAAHVSRFEYMNPELLYRSDNIFDMEMNRLGLNNAFSKYGYELPNFQYVRYRIPVKAGKTYYIAGRGTKNGFSAIRFDALAPNTNINGLSDLLYTDNPTVEENDKVDMLSADYLKLKYGFDDNGKRDYKSTERSKYDLTGKTEGEVLGIYDKEENVTTITIKESGSNTTTINGCIYKNGNDGVKLGVTGDDDPGNLVGKTVNVKLDRTFRAYNWHPIILPFSLSETRVEQYFGEGTVILYLDPYAHTVNNKVDETTGKSWTSAVSPALEGTKLSFTYHRYHMLYANTPAFICPTFTWSTDVNSKKYSATENVRPTPINGVVEGLTFKRVTLDGSNSRNFLSDGYIGYPISNDYEVVGSYNSTDHTGDIYYVNNTNPTGGKDGNKAQLVHSNGYPVTMKGTRVWIRPRAGVVNAAPILTVGSKGFSDFEEDSESAGISDIVADDYTIEGYDIHDDGVYDLLGRKVGQGSLDGLLKGVYIFQGKKVYVK